MQPNHFRVVMANDHAGYPLKNELKTYIETLGHTVDDLGTHDETSVDYPIYGRKAAEALAYGDADFAVLVCGTGFGISLAANTVPGVRCVNCSEPFTAKMSRQHNDANALALGARVIGTELAKMTVEAFLGASFQDGRHIERIAMIEKMRTKAN
jgi:ribose 5-phosphate isomerase B